MNLENDRVKKVIRDCLDYKQRQRLSMDRSETEQDSKANFKKQKTNTDAIPWVKIVREINGGFRRES